MSFPKLLGLVTVLLFSSIFVAALLKGGKNKGENKQIVANSSPVAIVLDNQVAEVVEGEAVFNDNASETLVQKKMTRDEDLPYADRINELFNTAEPKLPFVETISYTSRVPWIKGRPAWIADYAAHFKTSRYFISRSLSRAKNYFAQNIVNGDRFNIFNKDKDFSFHLVVDISRSKLWFYAYDHDKEEKTLLRTYEVGLGRLDEHLPSGSLTPLGTYSFGNRVAIYKPGIKGFFNHKKVEMIRVFGSRWIPFEEEIYGCTAPAKGMGIHGLPWGENEKTGKLEEDQSSIGMYESDGCIRLKTDDIEELYSIVITQPTYIHLVADFFDAKLPGLGKASK
ncbi:MAG: hypothetical protein ACI9S8_000742 [Chlamydiales bacterium]|jgi:hypothetical protein